MSYKIVIEKPAMKFLQKQQQSYRDRIIKAIQALPNTGDIKQMAGYSNLYRLRVGSFRILYTIENDVLVVRVINIGNRGDVYK